MHPGLIVNCAAAIFCEAGKLCESAIRASPAGVRTCGVIEDILKVY